jgi:antitoxin FitA
MPVDMTVRNVPDVVVGELVARAARSGQSLEEYLRAQLVEMASAPSPEEEESGALY